jgi:gentisate 1,2-dioxygenase
MTITQPARRGSQESGAHFADVSGQPLEQPVPWRPLKVAGEEIDAEIARLAEQPKPADGRRAALIVHPESTAPGLGFSPAIDVTIEVLLPGESTSPVRRNSGQVTIGIQGGGQVHVQGRDIALAKWDVANIPSMKPYVYRNTGSGVWARLTYSNAPLLAKLGVGYAEPVSEFSAGSAPSAPSAVYNRDTAPDFEVSPFGSRLRGYEFLTDIEVVDSNAHHWPWSEVRKHLSTQRGDGKRTIMAMYNPATERRNGANHSFFVTAFYSPAGGPPRQSERGHRHTSTAINYHFLGEGSSKVDGEVIEWKAGDLLLSAPGWREHRHTSGPNDVGVFTVQDHPLHIGMESLIWQEDMEGPILTLGSEAGLTGYVGPREAGQ